MHSTMSRRHALVVGTVGAGAVLQFSNASAAEGKKHTFVLQHGAWHGGWCWLRVAERLRAMGHRVYTPTSTGLGERQHLLSRQITLDVFVEDLVNVLQYEDLHDVILIGHSFGGITISGAADRAKDRITKLVYLDAVILQPGQSPLSSIPPEAAAQRRASIKAGGGISLPVPPTTFFGIPENSPDGQWLKRQLTPHPAMTYDSPLQIQNPVGNGLPTTYIGCTKDPLASIESMRQWARAKQGWQYIELAAVHNAMMTEPQKLTELLVSIADTER